MLAGLLWNTWSFFTLFSMSFILVAGTNTRSFWKKLILPYGEISPFQKYGVMIAGWCIMMYCASPGFAGDIGNAGLHNAGLYGGLLFLFILPVAEILYTRKTYLAEYGLFAAWV